MLSSVGGALLYLERRRLIDVFPDHVREVWRDWEVQVLVLLSLILQIVLILLGNRRKYMGKTRVRITIWSAYLLADWIATVALGVISQRTLDDCKKDESSKDELMSFWAPFLLLHLGGPDTITAYSLEDNELWLRHLVGLLIQTGLAFYVLLVALPGSSWLPFLSIPIFLAGLIKYGERTLALRSANKDHLRDSLLTPPDPGPNYAKFMEEFTLKKAEGFYVQADEVKELQELPISTEHSYPADKSKLIPEAFDRFKTFKRLFVDLILSFQDRDSSQAYFQKLSPKEAFDVIEVELGFAFDVFFTKAPVVYTVRGCFFRMITFCWTCFALIAFALQCEASIYRKADLIVTYLLLAVAILLELYAAVIVINSDWTANWLNNQTGTWKFLLPKLRELLQHPKELRWSNSMAQYNLLSFCLNEKPAVCYGIQKLLQIDDFREKHRYKTYALVSDELKDLIFKHFYKFTVANDVDPTALCTHKGSFTLRQNDCIPPDWSTKQDFDQRILIWHIATDICYYLDSKENDSSCIGSKNMSDYMMYLLVLCPFMLPIGIGMIRFRDTCAEAIMFFEERNLMNGTPQACAEKLLQVNTEVSPLRVKGDRSKSVLFEACCLAKQLQKIGSRWDLISQVWVEMLAYAAIHCRGYYHAQQLRKGGELLTHIWLLMAHLGITGQFQINRGHARAKLIVK